MGTGELAQAGQRYLYALLMDTPLQRDKYEFTLLRFQGLAFLSTRKTQLFQKVGSGQEARDTHSFNFLN